ncbi:MAG: electron transfer flavoprotein subunit beta [Gammaproteobacteria bacterium]|jgi:electron transfer flavoprotein alpha subunit|nr:electron transfer flavoprotein subunit beta [Gammaproteobacteria bacterium]
MKVLVIAEHDNRELKTSTVAAIAAAQKLALPIEVLVAGYHCQTVVEKVRTLAAISRVIVADHDVYQDQLAENLALLLHSLSADYSHILAAASTFGKDVLPRLAGLLQVSMASDVMEIIDANTFIRPIYAGNALATVRMHDAIRLVTVRSSAFNTPITTHTELAELTVCDKRYALEKTKLVKRVESKSERPELGQAKVVISGGRGLQNKENFALIEQLADKLNAAVGASRAAVDAGFVPNDYQVGQTGKVVAPDLYIAIGISGAIQHLAGMKDSRVIVAINKDAEAPIFQIADYGLVGDLFKIIPELLTKLP